MVTGVQTCALPISEGVSIGKNTAVSGVTTAEDYPNGALASGGYILKKEGKR